MSSQLVRTRIHHVFSHKLMARFWSRFHPKEAILNVFDGKECNLLTILAMNVSEILGERGVHYER